MSSDAAVVERAIAEVLGASLPPHLRDTIGPAHAKEWVGEHIDTYAEDKLRMPWCNLLAYDSWTQPTFFVVLVLKEDALELFCGTGHWPKIREWEDEAESVAAADLYREWSSRFDVPCPPLALGKAAVKAWLGRDW
jgi:hypothetical protein